MITNELDFATSLNEIKEIGYIEFVSFQIVYVSGLPGARPHELVLLETGELGQVMSLSRDFVEVLIFSKNAINVGTKVARTNKVLEVPVGDEIIGSVLSPLGDIVYTPGEPKTPVNFAKIDSSVPGIKERRKITQSLETGVAVVDLMIPLGKGQRQLVIGDRDTGKSDFFMQTILSQAKMGTVCIYAGIAKKKAEIKKIVGYFEKSKVMDKMIVVASSASDPLAFIYLTPFVAMTIAESFRDRGIDTLLVLDDLTNHAKYYREIALLAKRFPGKSSYPGDIFYTHSRLLERAGNFVFKDDKTVSISCLPVAETIEGDISGYIQTNIMSITDGHVFFDKDLFVSGRRPAINYFLSVTRVGRQTQSKIRWGINHELNTFLSLYEKSQNFIHFGAELNEGLKSTLEIGEKILSFFDQPMGKTFSLNVQIIVFCLLWIGTFKDESSSKIRFVVERALALYQTEKGFKDDIDNLINGSADFNDLLSKTRTRQKELMTHMEL